MAQPGAPWRFLMAHDRQQVLLGDALFRDRNHLVAPSPMKPPNTLSDQRHNGTTATIVYHQQQCNERYCPGRWQWDPIPIERCKWVVETFRGCRGFWGLAAEHLNEFLTSFPDRDWRRELGMKCKVHPPPVDFERSAGCTEIHLLYDQRERAKQGEDFLLNSFFDPCGRCSDALSWIRATLGCGVEVLSVLDYRPGLGRPESPIRHIRLVHDWMDDALICCVE